METFVESDLLRKYYSHLQHAMLHPSVIASELYSQGFIDGFTRDGSKSAGAEILVKAIEAYFSSSFDDSSRKDDFLAVLHLLGRHTPLNKVVDKIKEEYGKQIIRACIYVICTSS